MQKCPAVTFDYLSRAYAGRYMHKTESPPTDVCWQDELALFFEVFYSRSESICWCADNYQNSCSIYCVNARSTCLNFIPICVANMYLIMIAARFLDCRRSEIIRSLQDRFLEQKISYLVLLGLFWRSRGLELISKHYYIFIINNYHYSFLLIKKTVFVVSEHCFVFL